jgi:hypothetical protein
MTPPPIPEVDFWGARLATNREVTVGHCLDRCDETGRIANFRRAAGWEAGPHEGARYNDSDVFKVLEGAARVLLDGGSQDQALAGRLRDIVAAIAAAQEDDGYLYTPRTIDPSALRANAEGVERWSYLLASHELYNLGHLYEAALVYTRASGDPTLADVADRSVALVAATFGPELRHDIPGHQEIEIALLARYQELGDTVSLDLARYFLAERGNPAERRELSHRVYLQDHLPLARQTEAVGHAVRAVYQYTAMAQYVALTGDPTYRPALDALWTDVVGRKLYLTGGIGARGEGESFGEPFELPNEEAYAETCAAIALVLWSRAMWDLDHDGRRIDVLERALTNGVLAGVGLEGDRFFYPNPLAAPEGGERVPWFYTACCPSNVVRLLPRVPDYAVVAAGDTIFVNLAVAGRHRVQVAGEPVQVSIKTGYPWTGEVEVELSSAGPVAVELAVRVPGWSLGVALPSDLYRYTDGAADDGADRYRRHRLQLDQPVRVSESFAMPVRRVTTHPAVAAAAGLVAVERGPVVYCAEGIDNAGAIPPLSEGVLVPRWTDELGGCVVLDGDGVTLVPYHLWAHRGFSPMAVWFTTG